MEKITAKIRKEAKKLYANNNILDFINLFFSGIYETKEGIEFETWTNGGVNMIHYLHKSEGCYFKQISILVSDFNIDYEIDLHRQDERYRQAFKIKESVIDFESYLSYLQKIASIID